MFRKLFARKKAQPIDSRRMISDKAAEAASIWWTEIGSVESALARDADRVRHALKGRG